MSKKWLRFLINFIWMIAAIVVGVVFVQGLAPIDSVESIYDVLYDATIYIDAFLFFPILFLFAHLFAEIIGWEKFIGKLLIILLFVFTIFVRFLLVKDMLEDIVLNRETYAKFALPLINVLPFGVVIATLVCGLISNKILPYSLSPWVFPITFAISYVISFLFDLVYVSRQEETIYTVYPYILAIILAIVTIIILAKTYGKKQDETNEKRVKVSDPQSVLTAAILNQIGSLGGRKLFDIGCFKSTEVDFGPNVTVSKNTPYVNVSIALKVEERSMRSDKKIVYDYLYSKTVDALNIVRVNYENFDVGYEIDVSVTTHLI